MQKQKILTGIILAIIIGLMGTIVFSDGLLSQKNKNNDESEQVASSNIVIFSADNCPYCKEVADWIKQNDADQIIDLEIKSVSENRDHAKELEQAAISCRINPKQVGVPLLYVNDQCFSGSMEIIEFLSQKMNEISREMPVSSDSGQLGETEEVEIQLD